MALDAIRAAVRRCDSGAALDQLRKQPQFLLHALMHAGWLGHHSIMADLLDALPNDLERRAFIAPVLQMALRDDTVAERAQLIRFLYRRYLGPDHLRAAALGKLEQVCQRVPTLDSYEVQNTINIAQAAEQCEVVLYFYRRGYHVEDWLPTSVAGLRRYWWALRRLNLPLAEPMQRFLRDAPAHYLPQTVPRQWNLNIVLSHDLCRYMERAL